jgi:enediyne polyketide synthase
MTPAVAIVGMACRYPDADSPEDLWCNVLAQRRAFRRLPAQRLRLDDYFSLDPEAPDHTYSTEAAVLDGWQFDRLRFKIAGSTFRSTDLAHWLALDVAAGALADAGYPDGEGLNRTRTGVIVGNTLTGEFSRARLLRLRWPYVRRVVGAQLARAGWDVDAQASFLRELEVAYKLPFDPVDEDTLAGGLSNTIAGRICNSFDFNGGGYTVDGACAASLLSVITACSALVAEDVDVAIAGGVDLSLDPFELVGFAKAGALARDEMRVYDARADGFWPGEGCGFVVVRRLADALADGQRVHAVVRGWGVSSDGRGGITRPELDGQLLAVRRAYHRAGLGIDSVHLFEGHGTGTRVGDTTELAALSQALDEARTRDAAAIGSIKANIGHTKAAAGIAGLIKAAMAVRERVIPPTTGCEEPHETLRKPGAALRIVREPEEWPAAAPPRAGVSAMGFGGINTHLVLETPDVSRKPLAKYVRRLGNSAQDVEVFLFGAADESLLDAQLAKIQELAGGLSRAELADLADELARGLGGDARAAVVAQRGSELAQGLAAIRSWLAEGVTTKIDETAGAVLGVRPRKPRVGFLFPGQGSPTYLDAGALGRRFPFARKPYRGLALEGGPDLAETSIAQPAIIAASLAGLAFLRALGVEAVASVGHSLGELTALHWAGALGAPEVIKVATARGQAMAELARDGGAMASLAADESRVEEVLSGEEHVVIAGLNAPRQTVVSGPEAAVARVCKRAERGGIEATRLPVSHAFHSPLVAPAAHQLASELTRIRLDQPTRPVASTVTGNLLASDENLCDLLVRQVTSPVRFAEALGALADRVDLLLEVGPGRVLTGLARQVGVRALPLDAGGQSLRGPLFAAGVLFAHGIEIKTGTLFAGRFTRRFDLDRPRAFLTNPCERAPTDEVVAPEDGQLEIQSGAEAGPVVEAGHDDPLTVVRRMIAVRAELPAESVTPESRLLGDLHLNSIQVAEIAAASARSLGVVPPPAPSQLATATVGDLASTLTTLEDVDSGLPGSVPAGVASWVRPFETVLLERPEPDPPLGEGTSWHILTPAAYPLRDAVSEAFAGDGRDEGILVCLPSEPDEASVSLLLEAARFVQERRPRRLALLQHGRSGSAFAKSLFLEAGDVDVCVVDAPLDKEALARAWLEAETTVGFREVTLDAAGRRRTPVLRQLEAREGGTSLTQEDVLLVSGGGKGIGAECALALARSTGMRLILLGRARPEEDEALAENLRRFEASGVRALYCPADVTDPEAVRTAVDEAEAKLGPVTALFHAAGKNEPALLSDLDEEAVMTTLAPKVDGLRNLLSALEGRPLRLLVGFGSIIGRTGLRGEAHYALANEWLAREIVQAGDRFPGCRCLNVEWSVWSGAGMGERLGSVRSLEASGVTAIPVEDGVRMLADLLAADTPASVVVAGRFGPLPTIELEDRTLPFLRFLERPQVVYPGIEVVADAELSLGTDPYLADHVLDGTVLLPAVLELEAAAQGAMAAARRPTPPVFSDVEISRPVTVPTAGTRTVRLAALVTAPNEVVVAIRSDETGFAADHFRAVCSFDSVESGWRSGAGHVRAASALDEASPLYDALFFQRGRFQRLRGYRRLHARSCVAEVEVRGTDQWFADYLPTTLVLGDPGARDAYLHAVQACIPSRRLVPVGVDRFATLGSPERTAVVSAHERSSDGLNFIYDLEVRDEGGRLVECWDGLALRSLGEAPTPGEWPALLLPPYLERRLADFAPEVEIGVGLADGGSERRVQSDAAIRRALGRDAVVRRRPDGKPEVDGAAVSATHVDGITVAVAGSEPIACDAELVVRRDESLWMGMLGKQHLMLARLLASEVGEDLEIAAARVWTAVECAQKAGRPPREPLTALTSQADGWVVLRAGDRSVATFVTKVRSIDSRLALGFLLGGGAR